jgi:hypothetical protein
VACAWLWVGFDVALGDFGDRFCIHPSSFCIRPIVALGGFSRVALVPSLATGNTKASAL